MNKERFNFKKAFYFEVTLIVLFLLSFILYVWGLLPQEFEGQILGIVGFIGIIPVVRSAFHSLVQKRLNVDLLATIALFFSFISAEWSSMLFINLMLAGARTLDLYTVRRIRTSLASLTKLKPSKARVQRNGSFVEVPISEIKDGDFVIVNLGEQIPVDGIISEGSASVNQASLTGESMPATYSIGDTVLAATIVVSGCITVQTIRIGAETTFEKMIKLVERSQSEKTRMRTLVERFASWYIGIMLAVSTVLYFITGDTRLVLAVVLVVCADDIAIAIPLAYIAAIGTAAKRGVIIKSADFLEQAAKITTLIVDKTGTLTLGKHVVTNLITFERATKKQVLELSGNICTRSNHPVSRAIMEFARANDCECAPPREFMEFEGRGMVGKNNKDQEIVIGRFEFLVERGFSPSKEVEEAAKKGVSKGNNVTLLAVDGVIIGLFTLADKLRPGTLEAFTALKETGVREVVILTGDNEGVAKSIADHLGISKYYSKLLPEHKVHVLKDYIGKNDRVVGMVGDGVNDAAVLARADVGIAMGGIGSDAAIDSADIVLMKDDFWKIVELREISQKVLLVARENFAIWAVVNAIGLYFVFAHYFTPSYAAAYNFLTDFIPIANSLRLFKYKGKNVY